jgi:threonine synthase
MHGARVLAVDGNFDDALRVVRRVADEYPLVLVNSLNPNRIEGQKTGAFEICDVLGRAPDVHAIPVGNAGNITAYWKGYREYHGAGRIDTMPRMLGFQAEGAAPIVRGHPIERPETIATAIRIGNPASWKSAVAAADESGGSIDMVSDREILDAYHLLAAEEGLFVEPASAASVAGLMKARRAGLVDKGLTAVCILTGHGLKDPERAVAESEQPPLVEPTPEAILEYLEVKT